MLIDLISCASLDCSIVEHTAQPMYFFIMLHVITYCIQRMLRFCSLVTFFFLSTDELYVLDLTKEKDLRVRIGQRKVVGRRFTPVCEICKAAEDCSPELEIEGGRYYKISFLCQDMKSLSVDAVKEICRCS